MAGIQITTTHTDEDDDSIDFTAIENDTHEFKVAGRVVIANSAQAVKFARTIIESVYMVDGNGGRDHFRC